MATQRFRSAFHGFHREDVVRYIEYLNNQHNAQVEQLNTQLQNALATPANSELEAKLAAALERCAQLEAQLAGCPVTSSEQELEAYRRAERAERIAQERAQQIRTQANAVLADAAVKAEFAAERLAEISRQANAQMQAYQDAINGTQALFQDVISALAGIQPENDD